MGIFVSYSHKDKDAVSHIVNIVDSCTENEIWYDGELRGGDRYFSVIAREIRNNEIFMFMVSDNSVQSEWCMQELQFAMSEHRKIIAVWLEDIQLPPEVKFIIQNTHYIMWNNDEKQFVREIKRCFSEEKADGSEDYRGEDESLTAPVTDKYFVPKAKTEQIKKLLEAERENRFSYCFESENAVLLGLAYEIGIHTEKDILKAKFYYQVGMFHKNVDASYLYASLMMSEDPENREKYLADMKKAADDGGLYAMTEYGDICYEGKLGVEVDREYALTLWEKAAELGSAEALYYMAYSYRWGDIVEKNSCLALMFALKAMEYEFPRAYRILAGMYEYGEFVEKNLEQAKAYYNEAIRRNDYVSVYLLGGIYYFDEENYEESIKLFEQALKYAEEGKIKNGKPYYYYGISLFYGDGIKRDTATAISYYFIAAEKNHSMAKKHIVDKICEAYSGKERLILLEKASKLDCKDADYRLGMHYLDGGEVETAVEHFKNGGGKGCGKCLKQLISTYSFVIGAKDRESYRNRELAIKYYQMFFSLSGVEEFTEGVLDAYYYAYGIELAYDVTNPDIDLAVYYFEKSLELDANFMDNIVNFAVDGFLFPETSGSGLKKSIENCEKILTPALKYMEKFYNKNIFPQNENAEPDIDAVKNTYEKCAKGYAYISEMYRKGEGVKRDKEKSEKYKNKALAYLRAGKNCAPGTPFEQID